MKKSILLLLFGFLIIQSANALEKDEQEIQSNEPEPQKETDQIEIDDSFLKEEEKPGVTLIQIHPYSTDNNNQEFLETLTEEEKDQWYQLIELYNELAQAIENQLLHFFQEHSRILQKYLEFNHIKASQIHPELLVDLKNVH